MFAYNLFWRPMKPPNTEFADRRSASMEAKQAMLARFKPKPTVTAAAPVDRNAQKLAKAKALREARDAEKEAKRIAREAAEAVARAEQEAAEQAALEAKREERKARKAAERTDAQNRRLSKLSAYAKAGTSDF
jgi:hypothetical protein